jgi:predicted phosphodiesterase
MQRIVRELPNNCEIIAGGDTHLGSIMAHITGIEYAVNYIASGRNRFFIHLGDWIEAIMVNDPRYTLPPKGKKEKENSIPLEQAKDAVKLFKPIRKRIITGLWGNHERLLGKFGNLVEKVICSKEGGLDIPYGTEVCRIIFTHKDKPFFNILAMHGKKQFTSNAKDYGQRQANMKASMKLYLQEQAGDCAIMLCGHAHKIMIEPPERWLVLLDGVDGQQQKYLQGLTEPGYIQPDQRWYACCGSARKSRMDGYDDYAQCYPAADLGFVKIVITDGQIEGLYPFLI